MDLFARAKMIRLVSHRDTYLVAEDDHTNVTLGRDPLAENAVWAVELVANRHCLRLRSCYGTYLTASAAPFLPGVTARRVVQARRAHQSSETVGPDEWEPYRDGMQVRLRSVWGNFLRPNGGLPPWRNSVTHDVPHRSRTRDKVLWDVEVVERWAARQGPPPSFCRSRSVVGVEEKQKQSELRRVLLLEEQVERSFFDLKCCWCPRAQVELSR